MPSTNIVATSLPFLSLPIDVRLFHTEILLFVLAIVFLAVFFGYQYIRLAETSSNLPKKLQDIPLSRGQKVGDALEQLESLIESKDWLEEDISKKWFEKLLVCLEIIFELSFSRTEMIENNTQVPKKWNKLFLDITFVRYNPNSTDEEKKGVQNILLSELKALRENSLTDNSLD